MELLTVAIRTAPPFEIITLAGQLDVTNAAQAEQAVESARLAGSVLIFDMTRLTFMDSSGVRVLVRARRRVPPAEVVVLAGLSPSVARIVQITRLDRIFAIYPSLDEALAALAGTMVTADPIDHAGFPETGHRRVR